MSHEAFQGIHVIFLPSETPTHSGLFRRYRRATTRGHLTYFLGHRDMAPYSLIRARTRLGARLQMPMRAAAATWHEARSGQSIACPDRPPPPVHALRNSAQPQPALEPPQSLIRRAMTDAQQRLLKKPAPPSKTTDIYGTP